ncbi:LuxR C-terminal-related transcriptional regulator [Thiotrichales bacterium 19X7-9]|nr:LuxR C-terminal-related transcriptional regulator [Thiotrichales bacterium 19X7-9]
MHDKETIKLFCKNMEIPLLILDNKLSLLYFNQYSEMILKSPSKNINLENAIEALFIKNNDTYIHEQITKTEYLTIQWNKFTTLECNYFITLKVIDRKPINHFNAQFDIKQLIGKLPVSIFVKDSSGVYLESNQFHRDLARLPKINGMTDYDLPWHQTADKFTQHEKNCIQNGEKPYYFCEQQNYINEDKNIIQKTKLAILRSENNQLYVISFNMKDIHNSLFAQYAESTGSPNVNINFSTREMECINWLVKGKSAQEIAIILGISAKTVQWHINNIKDKFGCYKISKLAYLAGKFHGHFLETI